MNHQLTTIAALPGSGGGCMSALGPEVAEPASPIGATLSYRGQTYVLTKPVYADKVQMKAPYFQRPDDSTGIYSFEEGGLVRIGDVSQ